MHEVSIANDIINIVRQNLTDPGIVRVKSVKLDLGEFSNIQPDSLRFGFQVLSAGTNLEGAQLDINLIPLTIKCSSCGNVSSTESGFFYCSLCGSNDVNVLSGKELKIVEIEIYDN